MEWLYLANVFVGVPFVLSFVYGSREGVPHGSGQ